MPDFNRKKLETILSKINHPELMDRIILTGYINNTDLPALYSLCEVFLYPSLRESFGIPILEAMKCGVPVITSDTSSMPEIAGDAALLVNPENTGAINSAMQQLTSNDKTKSRLIEKGYQQSDKFSWKKMAHQVLDIYLDFKQN
jgi:glycosyltransferase involved in cell wall biosynthesis